jgi:hypothetical protein
LSDQGATNAAFFELRSRVMTTGVCERRVFLEDTDVLETTGETRTWSHFNFHTARYVLTLSGCAVVTAPRADLAERLAQAGTVWLIIPEQSAATFSPDVELQRVMSIAPAPALPAELSLALFRASPR